MLEPNICPGERCKGDTVLGQSACFFVCLLTANLPVTFDLFIWVMHIPSIVVFRWHQYWLPYVLDFDPVAPHHERIGWGIVFHKHILCVEESWRVKWKMVPTVQAVDILRHWFKPCRAGYKTEVHLKWTRSAKIIVVLIHVFISVTYWPSFWQFYHKLSCNVLDTQKRFFY